MDLGTCFHRTKGFSGFGSCFQRTKASGTRFMFSKDLGFLDLVAHVFRGLGFLDLGLRFMTTKGFLGFHSRF